MKKVWGFMLFGLLAVFLVACSDKGEEVIAEPEVTEDGKTVITIAYKDDGPSSEASVKYYDALEVALKEHRDLDVEFNIVEIAQGDYAEKLNLLLYSGEIPDIIYFQGSDEQIASQGLLEDLTPYIEGSEYLKDILYEHNVTRLENYPYLLWVKPINHKVPVVRTDYLEQISTSESLLADPSPENYKAFFQEMVDKGLSDYGVTVAGDIAELDFIFNMAFGVTSTWLEDDNGSYVYKKVSEAEKAKLAYYAELYAAGLLDNQYLTKQWDVKEDDFYNNKAGVIVGTNGKVIDLYNTRTVAVNGEGAELTVLPSASGVSSGYAATSVTKEPRGLAISSQSANKIIAFEILDFLASPEGMKLDLLGYEGEQYTIEGDEVVLTEKFYSEWFSRFWEPQDVKLDTPISSETPLLSPPGQASTNAIVDTYVADNDFTIPEEYISQWDAMENLYKEYAADIITGKISIDEFDTFVEEWYAAGGEGITKLANETIK
ncbi:extracellular solute-binding protein [Ureibacillus chungkukjangi]|uniref:Carbohydrate ABC transporter substrate-binding protein (CUT1 family) n=1 Tax=Ureibacillus chungkukjangi TaxID=1202712 RepID=A0A318TW06_9BACL|nr:extracellular solute-binding protein [Ureibacillus chungkukjangi]MCM3387498.1 extracellular solute-binding protein [Ureibacillus chungkukjangi]PYF09016.1 carbohydrate ABC transporter substrate-binding protein (CUT1 family) [Ureibacillus chungkukjangi]